VVKRADGTLELEIMQVLWSSPTPMSPNEVRELLSGNLAYTSVATVLTRLCDKNQVKRTIAGRNFVYVASVSREDWYSNRMNAILNETKNHRELLAGFVGKLSKRDQKDLKHILGLDK
jgi:predicted transcriptional regulator